MCPFNIERDLARPTDLNRILWIKRSQAIWRNNVQGRGAQAKDTVKRIKVMRDGRALVSVNDHNRAACSIQSSVEQSLDVVSFAHLAGSITTNRSADALTTEQSIPIGRNATCQFVVRMQPDRVRNDRGRVGCTGSDTGMQVEQASSHNE